MGKEGGKMKNECMKMTNEICFVLFFIDFNKSNR